MKKDFNDIFTDIDDKLIAQAKPTAQKPMEFKPETRSETAVWKKITAAAACLAVLGTAGGVIALNSAKKLPTASPASSASVSLTNDSGAASSLDGLIYSMASDAESKSAPAESIPIGSTSAESDPDEIAQIKKFLDENRQFAVEQIKKWEHGTEFLYEGKSYKVFTVNPHGSGLLRDRDKNIIGVEFCNAVSGVRREIINGVDTVEFVALVENVGTEPIGLMSSVSSPDQPILFRFVPEGDDIPESHHIFDDEEFKYMPVVVQPGEKYYQKVSFPVTEDEYRYSICVEYTDPEKFDETRSYRYNSTGGSGSNQWADFTGRGEYFDNVNELFGASNLSKQLNAAEKVAEEAAKN